MTIVSVPVPQFVALTEIVTSAPAQAGESGLAVRSTHGPARQLIEQLSLAGCVVPHGLVALAEALYCTGWPGVHFGMVSDFVRLTLWPAATSSMTYGVPSIVIVIVSGPVEQFVAVPFRSIGAPAQAWPGHSSL